MIDVSVLIPVYRADLTINRAIRSALAQSVPVEVICVDDCPDHRTHRTYGVMDGVLWFNHVNNAGPGAALETAANEARGRYCLMLGDDDWLEPGCLLPLVHAMNNQPALAFAYGATQYHGQRSDLHQPLAFRRDDFYHHFPALYAYLWRREWKEQYGLRYQDEVFAGRWLGAPDWDMALQLLRWGDGLALPDVTVLNHVLRQGRMTEIVRAGAAQVMASMRARHPELSEDATI